MDYDQTQCGEKQEDVNKQVKNNIKEHTSLTIGVAHSECKQYFQVCWIGFLGLPH